MPLGSLKPSLLVDEMANETMRNVNGKHLDIQASSMSKLHRSLKDGVPHTGCPKYGDTI